MTLELVFDFDGTITQNDSIASVLDAALSYHKANSSPKAADSLTDAWHHVVKSYMTDLDAYHKSFDPATQDSQLTSLETARVLFSNQPRRQIEEASQSRVKEAGLFSGVPLDHLFQSGHEHRDRNTVELRDGFSNFTRLIQSRSAVEETANIQILSVNWSASYIRGVLSREGISSVIANETNPADGSINALPPIDHDGASGDWPSVLAVGADKLSALRCVYRQLQAGRPKLPVEIICFGDSTTDLECLLEFGGIVISPESEIAQRPRPETTNSNNTGFNWSELLHVLRTRLRHNVPHVSEHKDELVCWARDFTEIKDSSFLRKRAANMKSTKA
ncbi:hypothetical protein Daus18300_011820 [Diaporthe australafricana]|uniref:Haloacid dehalogenase-like hydrolase n=1 Tax=Diaporthe australafricana TaxID=127596 RepID=A0ABR3W540_9PEZI